MNIKKIINSPGLLGKNYSQVTDPSGINKHCKFFYWFLKPELIDNQLIILVVNWTPWF
jgi:hypothetical protein